MIFSGTDELRETDKYCFLHRIFPSTQHHLLRMYKILMHYPDLGDLTPFFQWKLKLLPLLVDWLQRARACCKDKGKGKLRESPKKVKRRELSVVYKFVRGVPQSVVEGLWRQQLNLFRAKKRKIEDDEKELRERKRKLKEEENDLMYRFGVKKI